MCAFTHTHIHKCVCISQACPTLCHHINYSPPGSSVCGILQATVLDWVAIPFSRSSSQPREGTQISCTCIHKICPFTIVNIKLIAGIQLQQDPVEPSGWTASVNQRERVRQSLGLSLKFIFAWLLYTLNNIFLGEVHIVYTQGISKHYSNLTFNRNRMSPTCFFIHKSLFYHLAFRLAKILWLAPGVT